MGHATAVTRNVNNFVLKSVLVMANVDVNQSLSWTLMEGRVKVRDELRQRLLMRVNPLIDVMHDNLAFSLLSRIGNFFKRNTLELMKAYFSFSNNLPQSLYIG